MTNQGNDTELLKIIQPLFQDEDTTHQTIRKQSQQLPLSHNNKYKTETCRYWDTYKMCPFGVLCAFAHGVEQIREKHNTSHNYKTKTCLNFSKTGTCKYGQRCQFKHEQKQQPSTRARTMSFCQFLEVLPEKIQDNIPVRRLRFFSDFSQDDFEKINWNYKKPRMYSE